MIFRKAVLLLAAAIAITPAVAHAQLGVYGTVTVNRLSGLQGSPYTPENTNPASCTGTAAPSCQVNDNIDPVGGGGGVYYDFKTFGPVRIGADLRATITDSKQGAYTTARSSGAHIYSTLGGIRGTFHTPVKILKPYAQVSVGLARSDYGLFTPNTSTNSTFPGQLQLHNNLQFEGFAGVDLKVLPIMDFRVVELGYGAITSFGTNGHTYPIGSLSSGVVFHLPF
jgi:hypothetical protein